MFAKLNILPVLLVLSLATPCPYTAVHINTLDQPPSNEHLT
jgi:hypothetical protein